MGGRVAFFREAAGFGQPHRLTQTPPFPRAVAAGKGGRNGFSGKPRPWAAAPPFPGSRWFWTVAPPYSNTAVSERPLRPGKVAVTPFSGKPPALGACAAVLKSRRFQGPLRPGKGAATAFPGSRRSWAAALPFSNAAVSKGRCGRERAAPPFPGSRRLRMLAPPFSNTAVSERPLRPGKGRAAASRRTPPVQGSTTR